MSETLHLRWDSVHSIWHFKYSTFDLKLGFRYSATWDVSFSTEVGLTIYETCSWRSLSQRCLLFEIIIVHIKLWCVCSAHWWLSRRGCDYVYEVVLLDSKVPNYVAAGRVESCWCWHFLLPNWCCWFRLSQRWEFLLMLKFSSTKLVLLVSSLPAMRCIYTRIGTLLDTTSCTLLEMYTVIY